MRRYCVILREYLLYFGWVCNQVIERLMEIFLLKQNFVANLNGQCHHRSTVLVAVTDMFERSNSALNEAMRFAASFSCTCR